MIRLYTRTTCSRCDKAKEALKEKNIPFEEFIIGENITRETVVEMFPEAKILPIVTLDNTWIGGRDELIKMLAEGLVS